jgi:choline monooxygenase
MRRTLLQSKRGVHFQKAASCRQFSGFSLDIDEDVTKAHTPHADFYRSEEVFKNQTQDIFRQNWHFLPKVGEVGEKKGAMQPFNLLPGVLNEPLVVVRDEDGEINCLSNVCTHRGQLLVRDPQERASAIRCCYHGRKFDLKGKFRSMPQFEDAQSFPSPKDDLPVLPIKQFGPMSFVSLEPAVEFEKWIKPVKDTMGFLPLDEFKLDPKSVQSFDIDANWCLYVENFLEWLHLPFIHRTTLTPGIDLKEYSADLLDNGATLQLGMAKKNEIAFDRVPGHPHLDSMRVAAFWFHLAPNTMVNFYPWGISLNIVEPLAVNKCRVHYYQYVWKEELRDQFDLIEVEIEDQDAVEHQQKGIESRLYTRGRYSPSQEYAMHHFHRHLQKLTQKPEQTPWAGKSSTGQGVQVHRG